MQQWRTILFLFLALAFCLKELNSVKVLCTDNQCYAMDLGEDGDPLGEEDDSDEKSESDLLFSTLETGQAFGSAYIAEVSFNSYQESLQCSPFFEIHIPPPEMA